MHNSSLQLLALCWLLDLQHLVDLAGSEKSKQANTSGQRLSEANFINTSLLYLSNVTSALSENSESVSPLSPISTRVKDGCVVDCFAWLFSVSSE